MKSLRTVSRCALVQIASCLAAAALAACNADTNNGSTDAAIPHGDGGASKDLATGSGDGGADLACTPEYTSCNGLCGPVHDDCTGQTFQCGACASGTVCDLDTHVCVNPITSCADFTPPRVCGSTKDSCGNTIQCNATGTCADDSQYCDPDSNQCVACQQVSCSDLGYECGPAWLGCGPRSNQVPSCGSCDSSSTCNDALHVCEPSNGGTCGGTTPTQMCKNAAMSDGVQCGTISNGCGGLIDCTATDPTDFTCPQGTFCGGAGIDNQCAATEVPVECVTAGYTCGTLASACGGTVSCGTCSGTNITCLLTGNSTAGVCGTNCNMPMKTCAVDYNGMCGTQLNNNCWPNLLDCPCATGVCSTASSPGMVGTCGAQEACSQYTDGTNTKPCSTGPSSAFPEGNGMNLTCPCNNQGTGQGQESCINIGSNGAGTCCTHPTCTGNEATVMDTCTGQTVNCCKSPAIDYNGSCCTPMHTCPSGVYTTGTDNCGQKYTCDCSLFGMDDPTNPQSGEACCAKPQTQCTTASQCGATVTSSCSGKTATCTAGEVCPVGSGDVCNGGTCCTPNKTCTANVYETGKSDGCGGTYNCGCSSGYITPKDSSGNPVQGATCCLPAPGCGNDCSGDTTVANCGSGNLPNVSNAGTQTITCAATDCGNGRCCKSGMCVSQNVCPGGGSCASITDACTGATIGCGCAFSDETCNSNVCTCPAVTCKGCGPATQTNDCGNSASCGCTGTGQICSPVSNACCVPLTCTTGLAQGAECGSFTDSCTGNATTCGCTDKHGPNATCDTSTGQCQCTPTPCCTQTGNVPPCLQPGPYSNDGCNNAGACAT